MPVSDEKQNALFICSGNQWGSPTAEKIFRKHPLISVQSAGASPNARRKVSAGYVRWANVKFVMGKKDTSRVVAEFSRLIEGKTIHVLNMTDEYKYMDPELVDQLEQSIAAILRFG